MSYLTECVGKSNSEIDFKSFAETFAFLNALADVSVVGCADACVSLCLTRYTNKHTHTSLFFLFSLAYKVPLPHRYWHGRISKEEAAKLVCMHGSSFLLRWSATMPGVYFIVLSNKDATVVRHVKLERIEAGKRTFKIEIPTEGNGAMKVCEFPSLSAAVSAARRPYHMKHPVAGSQYWGAFQSQCVRLGVDPEVEAAALQLDGTVL